MTQLTPSDPFLGFEWRQRRKIIPLENFDFPAAHTRSEFNPDTIGGIVNPRMAGSSYKMTAEEIRDAMIAGNFDQSQKGSLAEIFEQCNGLDLRLIRHLSGVSLFELARAMIECNVTQPFVAEWMNCRSPNYEPNESELRLYRVSVYSMY